MAGIAFLRRLLMKQAMKKSEDASGILSLNKGLVNDVDTTVKKWIESAKKQGQDIDKMGEQEIKYILELNKPKGPTILGHPVIDATSPEGKGITRDLFNMLDRQSGKNVIKTDFGGGITDIVTETITKIKVMKPIDGMKEANSVLGRKGKYKNLTEEQSQKIIKDTEDHIFERNVDVDPEDFAHGGRTGTGLNYLLGEDDQNSRMPFGLGGISKARRAFLKLMGGAAAGTAAAKTGLLSIFKGGGTKSVIKDLASVPINNIDGMPVWFKPLVNRVIKEGDDVTKKFATKEREIVHTKKLDEFDEVTVTQDLDTGNVRVEYHGSGNMGEAPIQLDYKAGEMLEGPIKKGQPSKTKSEFSAVESEPEIVNWDGDIEWTGENVVNKVDDLLTDTTKLETYATGNKPNIKQLLKSEQKQKHVNNLHDDQMEQVNYIENKHGMSADDYIDEGARVGDFDPKGYRDYDTKGMNLPDKTKKASGGRVPLAEGKKVVDPGYFKYQEPDEYWPSRYEYDASNPKHMEKISDWIKKRKQELIEQGIIKQKTFSEKNIIPSENYLLEAIQNPELYDIFKENTPEELEEYEEVLRSKQEVKDGGRVPLGGGGIAGMLGE